MLFLIIGATINFMIRSPADAQAEREAEERQREVEQQPEAEAAELARTLEAREAELEALRRQEEARLRREEIEAGTAVATPATGRDAPAFDPALLAALEEADRQVGQRPAITAGTNRNFNLGLPAGPVGPANQPAPARAEIAAMFERYGDPPTEIPSLGEALGQEDRTQTPPAQERLQPEFFETNTPAIPPSSRIITQGSQIRAVLLSRIDTRNPGSVIAQVTSDTYDSLRAETLLIPKGARLLGSYENTVSPGNELLDIAFHRLMLPDGRAIDLGGMQATGNDGIVGVQGNYHSNFLRAIGPAILTTIVGSALDEATRPEGGQGAAIGVGGTVQSPTVAQQTVPKITDAVLERYRGARPYITADPGQPMKILVTADLEIPVLETPSR